MGKSTSTPVDDERTVVWLGNRNAVEVLDDPGHDGDGPAPKVRNKLPKGKRATTVVLPPGQLLMESAYDLTHPGRGVWQAHSDDDKPAWVASTSPALADLLAAHWACEKRDPEPADSTAPATDDDADRLED